MADLNQAVLELKVASVVPDPPDDADYLGIYGYNEQLWVVFADGTRRDLTGFTSLQAPVPVIVTTSYTVIANTQVVAKKITVNAGAMLLVEAGAYLHIL